jgi:hypothetical protein
LKKKEEAKLSVLVFGCERQKITMSIIENLPPSCSVHSTMYRRMYVEQGRKKLHRPKTPPQQQQQQTTPSKRTHLRFLIPLFLQFIPLETLDSRTA